MATGYRMYAGLKGSKMITVGADDTVYNYTDIPSAVAAAQANDVILVEPGTYTLTEKLTINKPLTIKGMRACGTKGVTITQSGALASEMVLVELVTQVAAAEVVFEDITFQHDTINQSAVKINNTNMATYTLGVRFSDCELFCKSTSTTSYALEVAHATAGAAIEVALASTSAERTVKGINFTVKNAGDKLYVNNMVLGQYDVLKAINSSADNIASLFRIRYCLVPHELMSAGGHASQILAAVGCTSVTGNTYALVDTNDMTGSHTEGIG